MKEKWGERQQAFLRELTELSRKHGIVVTGCGCCGSPDLTGFRDDPVLGVPPDGHYSANVGDGGNIEWVPAGEE